ncbi:hypothetical protein ABB30_15345 [Stenotrophomonas ginsengisoli]|uniref:Sel1 repeat family protein n=1 Tax=Stenotrophomonas ginsengisoli TaxID=336566 RepID=A0A0R0CTX3_9GAMM|nr:hypothetical protein ABB30_15345 [Stenotrophomonas ginsengisoli]
MDESQLDRLRQDADGGDAEAAFRVALHFSSEDNPEQYQSWTHRAAQLGHAVAQYNVWFYLRDSHICSEQLEALAWLESSAAQGVREAEEHLQSFQQQVAPCQVPPNNACMDSPVKSWRHDVVKL